jgi:hypothetical protein
LDLELTLGQTSYSISIDLLGYFITQFSLDVLLLLENG